MQSDVPQVLVSSEEIDKRVAELAAQIAADFDGKSFSVIIIANGAVFFAVDLLRRIPNQLQLDILAVSSYIGTQSSDEIRVRSELKINICDRSVLVIDDIFDSGQTLRFVVDRLKELNPREISTCVLLEKERPNQDCRRPDYAGFRVGNEFVVGYGLDYNESYRNLPFIGLMANDSQPAD